MSRCSGCCFVRNQGENLERSPALPLLPPCPLSPPHSPDDVFLGMGWREGADGLGESNAMDLTCFTRRGSHSFFLPPRSHSPGTCDLRRTSGLSYHSRPSIIWLNLPLQASVLPLAFCFAYLAVRLHFASQPLCISLSLPYMLTTNMPGAFIPLISPFPSSWLSFTDLTYGDTVVCSHHVWLYHLPG